MPDIHSLADVTMHTGACCSLFFRPTIVEGLCTRLCTSGTGRRASTPQRGRVRCALLAPAFVVTAPGNLGASETTASHTCMALPQLQPSRHLCLVTAQDCTDASKGCIQWTDTSSPDPTYNALLDVPLGATSSRLQW